MADEGFKIADAYVEVHATANQGDAKKAAEEIEAEADSSRPKVKVGAKADRAEGELAGQEVAAAAGDGFSSRGSFLSSIFSKTVRDAGSGLETEGSGGGRRFGSGFLNGVLPSIRSFGNVLDGLGPKVSQLGSAITRVGLVNVFVSLVTGALNFGAALGPVLGLIAAIPAVALAAAAALSTLAVGLSGVFGAFSAFGKATGGGGGGGGQNPAQQIHQLQEAVTQAAQSVQQAEHGIVIAERDVADAQRSTLQAQQALTQARLDAVQALEQYANAAADAQLSEQQAQFDLTDAQTTLNNYQKIGITSGEDYAKAQLAVAQAQQKLKESQENVTNTQQQNQQAQAAGVDGSQQVIQATDQLNKALEQQADAVYNVGQAQQQLTNAEQQLADAQYNLAHSAGSGGAAGGMNQFNAALAKLSPNARAFVLAVISLRGQFDALKKDVQDRLFANLDQEVLSTAKVTFPTLRTGMDLVATSFNNMGKAGFEAVKSPIFQSSLATVFRGTAQGVQEWAQATGPLVTGLANLAAVGMPFILQFTHVLTSWLTAKGVFLSSAEGAQHMHDVLQKASDAASNLWHIGEHLWEILKNIASAMHVDNLLASLSKITAEFAKWTGSAQGQKQLTQFFQLLGDTASKTAKIMPLVWDILSKIINFLEAHPAIKNLVEDFVAWAIVLGPMVSLVGSLIPVVTGLGTALMFIVDNPVVLVIAALAAAFIYAYENIKPFHNAVNDVASFLKTVAVDAFNILRAVVVTVFSLIVNIVVGSVQIVIGTLGLLSRIPGDVGGWFMSAYQAIVGALGSAVSFVSGVPGRILGALGNLGSLLYNAGKSVIQGLINGITDMANNGLKGALKTVTNLIPSWKGPEATDLALLQPAGQNIMTGLIDSIGSKRGDLRKMLGNVTGDIKLGSFRPGISGASSGGSNLPSAFGSPRGLQSVSNTTTTGSTITVGQLILQVNGAMDLTSDSDRKKLVRKIRDELVKLEASTR